MEVSIRIINSVNWRVCIYHWVVQNRHDVLPPHLTPMYEKFYDAKIRWSHCIMRMLSWCNFQFIPPSISFLKKMCSHFSPLSHSLPAQSSLLLASSCQSFITTVYNCFPCHLPKLLTHSTVTILQILLRWLVRTDLVLVSYLCSLKYK